MAAAFFAALNGRYNAKHHEEDASMRVVGGALADRGSMMMLAQAMTESAVAVREHSRAMRDHCEAIDRARIAVNDGVERIIRTLFDIERKGPTP